MNRRISARQAASLLFFAVLSLLLGAGCTFFPHKEIQAGMEMPRRLGHAQAKLPPITQRELQAEVMRFADRFSTAVDDATRDLESTIEEPEAHALAQHFKVDQMSAAITIAAGPNPTVNLMDMIVLLSLQTRFLEAYWLPEVYGEHGRPLLEAYRQLNDEIWSLANNVFQPGQRQDLNEVILDWLARNPESHSTGFIPFHEFAREAGKYPPSRGAKPGSIFSLLFLDPLAGLDPTRRAIEGSEYLAERSMFYLQHMPKILQERMQLGFLDIAQSREVQNTEAQIERFTRTTETLARAAEQLPENVREERTAAVKQILQGLGAERTNFFMQLFAEQQSLQVSLKEWRETFAFAKEAADNVNAAADALSGFVERIEEARARPSDPGSHPFDVREYGTAAREIGVGAEQLTDLLSTPQLNRALSQARKSGEQWTDHLFWRGWLLGSILIVQILLARLAYRYLVERITRKRESSGGPSRSR